MVARLIAACALSWLAVSGATAIAQSPGAPMPRLVFEIDGDISDVPRAPEGTPVARRVITTATASDAPPQPPTDGWPIWLTIDNVDAPGVDASVWPSRVRALLDAIPALAAVELRVDGRDPRRAAFLLKLAAAEIRARSTTLPIVLGGEAARADRRSDIVTPDVAPSVDALVLRDDEEAGDAAAWAGTADPGLELVTLATPLGQQPAQAFVAHQLARLGSPVITRGYGLTRDGLRAVLPVVGRLSDLYADIVPVTTTAESVTIRAAGADVTTARSWRLLYNLGTLATYLVVDSQGRGQERLDLSVTVPSAGTVVVRDPLTGRDRPALRTARDDAAQRTEATVVLPGPGTWLVDFNGGAAPAFIQQEDVTGVRTTSVEEILARHQARQVAERGLTPRYVVNGRIQQYFRPSLTDPGFDVVTENRFFVDRAEGTEWEERVFSVNGARFGEPRPPFPLLQPEKVLRPPLEIEFDARYRYRLAGTDTVNGRPAWAIAFEPHRRDESLYRGTVWIDRETYVRLRQQAVQTGLGAPVVSNDETQDFAPVRTSSGAEVWLPSSIYNQQLILVAGRNLLVERRITFDGYEIAPPDFAAQRQQARAGDRTMYRDTEVGVRYYVKEGEERVVSDIATTRAKALALGVTIDPGFRYPLPIGGINYLNFRFLGRQDTQVAVLFAGVLAAGNIQRPKAILGRIDASLDFFGMAPPSTDRLFGAGGEREEERLLTWPLSTGLNLGWQATSYQRVSAQYQFRFDGYVRDSTTSADFVTPSSTVTNGLGLLYEYRRSGYSLTASGVWARRASWRPWGDPEALTQTPASYAKYSVAATKVFYLGPLSKLIVNGSWFGGDRLDRFSQYQFGLFDDTRIHGVPSAGVRYGELAMARGQYSFNLLEQYRLDLFLDQAWGRVRASGVPGLADVPWEPITGVGVAFNVRVPGRTMMLRGEVGRSFLPDRYDGLGSTTLQVMLLKPL